MHSPACPHFRILWPLAAVAVVVGCGAAAEEQDNRFGGSQSVAAFNGAESDDRWSAWTSFRGPDGTGVLSSARIPTELGEDRGVKWKTPIPGRGWASPVVLEGEVWLATATEDGTRMSAVCVDAESGEILHEILVFENENPRFCHPTNSYASCTPAIEPGRLYLHFGRYGTACLDTKTGEKLWERRDLLYDDFRGPASSPILHDDLLLFSCDGIDVQYVVALDKQTGETVWKVDREIDYGSDNPDRYKAYSTPSVVEIEGVPQLVSPSAMETIAYAPRTGEVLWRVRHGGMNAALRPQLHDGLIHLTAGDGATALVAVDPAPRDAEIVWSGRKGVPKRSSPLFVKDRLFLVSDDGIVSCRDPRTGEVDWIDRLRDEFWASPVSDGERILACGKEGHVYIFAAEADEFRLLGEGRFESGFNATPALTPAAIYLRSVEALYRIE
jgi:outer membrane protein assembly factor BamB